MAIAIRAALFVRGLGTTVVSHESCMFRPTKGPEQRRIRLKYRAATLRVEIMVAAPIKQILIDPTMCQQCSSMRPDDQETASVTK